MANYKMFTTIILGSRHIVKYPVSLSTMNSLLETAFLGTCREIKFKTWDEVRTFIVHHFSKKFDNNNKMIISLHDIIEAKQKGLDPKPFTNSCIIFKVYDL